MRSKAPKKAVLNSMEVMLTLDDCDLRSFIPLAASFGTMRFGYVVTPNVDHLIRLHDDPSFRFFYSQASFVLLDSRVLAIAYRMLRGMRLRVCTGSDLVASLLAEVARTDDVVVLIGGSNDQCHKIKETYGLRQIRHFNPPMGFINEPAAVEATLQFIEDNSPFRFCVLAVGSPQQEKLAAELQRRGKSQGLAMCVGASIDFLTHRERRAPVWMRKSGLEWLFRLLQSPRRLAHRYLVRGPRVLTMLPSTRISVRCATKQ